MTTELAGAVAVVTGAASGIGRACAARLVREGATVFATDVDASLDEVASEIGAVPHHLDVADPEAWGAFAASIDATHDGLDVAVLNAGIRLGADDPTTTDVDDYLRLIGVNQHGVFFGVRTLTPLLERRGGQMVVTASRAGVWPLPNDLPYAMSKHAVVGLVRSAAPGLRQKGVRINALAPGTVDTGFLGGARARLEAAGIAVMESEDVAEGLLSILAGDGTGEIHLQPPGEQPQPLALPEGDR